MRSCKIPTCIWIAVRKADDAALATWTKTLNHPVSFREWERMWRSVTGVEIRSYLVGARLR